jgi:pimeloyl-ACP methyl ester carboxylesterase
MPGRRHTGAEGGILYAGFLDLGSTALGPGASCPRIGYRDQGSGPPIVFLHGGWGYEVYPFDRQYAALAGHYRIVIPDRSGYGASTPVAALPTDFHRRAMEETRAVLDALGLQRPFLWGHSDGAIIALLLGLAYPACVRGVIAEATHVYLSKPRSRDFFERMAEGRNTLPRAVVAALERDHGSRWPQLIAMHSRAWLAIGASAASPADDFYSGRLSQLDIPVLAIHGGKDPRTEPGELEALRAALQSGRVELLDEAGHSPHTEPVSADRVTRIASEFLAQHCPQSLARGPLRRRGRAGAAGKHA